MADINVERKGPSIWPWIIGLLVLALLIWAIAEMVDTDEPEVATVEEVQEPVTAVPTPTPVEPEAGAAELSTLMPLQDDDVGRQVMISGQVVGEPVEDGFWIMPSDAQNQVIFVQTPAQSQTGESLAAENLSSGQQVSVMGMIARTPAGQPNVWMQESQLSEAQGFESWNVQSDYMIGSSQTGMQGQQPGMQGQQPGMQGQQQNGQQAQPGDTVQGRY